MLAETVRPSSARGDWFTASAVFVGLAGILVANQGQAPQVLQDLVPSSLLVAVFLTVLGVGVSSLLIGILDPRLPIWVTTSAGYGLIPALGRPILRALRWTATRPLDWAIRPLLRRAAIWALTRDAGVQAVLEKREELVLEAVTDAVVKETDTLRRELSIVAQAQVVRVLRSDLRNSAMTYESLDQREKFVALTDKDFKDEILEKVNRGELDGLNLVPGAQTSREPFYPANIYPVWASTQTREALLYRPFEVSDKAILPLCAGVLRVAFPGSLAAYVNGSMVGWFHDGGSRTFAINGLLNSGVNHLVLSLGLPRPFIVGVENPLSFPPVGMAVKGVSYILTVSVIRAS